jgi:beta-lactamase class A
MIAAPAAATVPAAAPRIVAPAPYQVSFGRIVAKLPPGTVRVVVIVNGHRRAARRAHGGRETFRVTLPPKDVTIRVRAVPRRGRVVTSAPVGPVFGLPPGSAPRPVPAREDPVLARRIAALLQSFPGTAAAYVHDLRTGLGAAHNARARFPAASTLKLAIAVRALVSWRGPPAHGSGTDALFRSMLINSSNEAANALEVSFGGSTSGGSVMVNALMRSLGLGDTEMYGGYELEGRAAARPIPLAVTSQPSFGRGKYTSAADLGRLLAYVGLAAVGRGPLVHRGLAPDEARYLLDLLVHVADHGKADRFLPGGATVGHKAGWISTARHDNAIVFWPGGSFVVSVMTWRPGGAGVSSDVLAGRIARAALLRFQSLRRASG